MDDNPTRMIETDQSSCPIDAPEKSCRADSGAYIVHPARAAPSGTNRLDSITSPAAKNDQNDHMLMRGNAMSCVPILSGIRKFAYTPTSSGMMAKRSEEHTSELQSQSNLVCRLLLEKKKNIPALTLTD